MSRYIDTDKLINDIKSRISMVCRKAPYDAKWFTRLHDRQREIIGIIEEQPTVDAVEVVRCKDCTHFTAEDDREFGYCSYWENCNSYFGYCSGALRKEVRNE